MQISDDKVVSIHYTLKDDDGDVLDSSSGGEPLSYLQGHGNIIPGLEKALEGRSSGEKLEVTVDPGEGYGQRHDELVQDVPLDAFAGIDEVQPGMRFQAETPDGPALVEVKAVGEENVTIDGNHPLAGKTLHFSVEVTGVRDASREEIEHGHAHGQDEEG